MAEEKKQVMFVMNPTTKEEWEIYNDRMKRLKYNMLLRVFASHNYKLTPPEATFIRSALDSAIRLNQTSKEGAKRGEESGDTFDFGGEVLRRFFHEYHGMQGDRGKFNLQEALDSLKQIREHEIHNEQLFDETDRPEMGAYLESIRKK